MTMSRQAVWARSRGAKLHQKLLARERHGGKLFGSFPEPFQLPPAHAAFLGEAIAALGEDVALAVLRQQFDLYAKTGLPPWFVEESFSSLLGRPLGVPTR
jgi:hypothetical protein